MSTFLNRLSKKHSSLTNTQKMVIEYMHDHKLEASYMSLKELALAADVSEGTVISMSRSLGFQDFVSMRQAFRELISSQFKEAGYEPAYNDQVPFFQDLLVDFISTQKNNYFNTLNSLHLNDLETCTNLIMQARQVYVLGHDTSKIAADYLVHRLSFMQISSWAKQIGELDSLQAMLTKIDPDDLFIFISLPPYHHPSKNIVNYIEDKNGKIIVLTDSRLTPVITEKSHNLFSRTKAPYLFNTMSSIFALIEVLIASIAIKLGDELNKYIDDFHKVSEQINSHINLFGTEG